jgi:ABC-type branched-subunit amino acid transport system substrate-binding protein
VLPWQAAADAQQFGRTMAAEHKRATIVGTDRLYSPGSFTVPGSYVSAFAPDITAIPADGWLVQRAKATLTKFGILGAPVYAATHVVDDAIARVCRSGQTPTRSTVLPAIRATDEANSVLGQPIRFDAHGDLLGARWFLFHINSAGKYRPLAAH